MYENTFRVRTINLLSDTFGERSSNAHNNAREKTGRRVHTYSDRSYSKVI